MPVTSLCKACVRPPEVAKIKIKIKIKIKSGALCGGTVQFYLDISVDCTGRSLRIMTPRIDRWLAQNCAFAEGYLVKIGHASAVDTDACVTVLPQGT